METSAHDYQGWLQARPIREDIKKYFDLVLFSKNLVWIFIRIIAKILKSKLKIKAENLEKIFAENMGGGFSLFRSFLAQKSGENLRIKSGENLYGRSGENLRIT